VQTGQNELFKYYPQEDEDLRITVTARSGDPDLFVTTQHTQPRCIPGDSYWSLQCGNFTWSSRMFSTDQIILSRDLPCSPVVPSTYVDPSCNEDNAFLPSTGKPVYIGATQCIYLFVRFCFVFFTDTFNCLCRRCVWLPVR
jgi:hypothetical protein